MKSSIVRTRAALLAMTVALASLTASNVGAQGFAGPPPPAPAVPREIAPYDITGYWVAVVTEDWTYRMATAPKGDIRTGLPFNQKAREAANNWDPQRDIAAGEQCKAYGAPGLIRQPGRLHITWQDQNTMRIDFDAGTQTRILNFAQNHPESRMAELAKSRAGEPSLQGYSVASWRKYILGRGFNPGRLEIKPGGGGTLEVVTAGLRAGYLLRNGAPYSEQTIMTEYFDLVQLPDGVDLLVVTTVIDDPEYLNQQAVISTHFKREPNGSKFNPRPCSAT